MKMMMPLLAPAPGCVKFMVQEGASLTAGTLIGELELDDPMAVVSYATRHPYNSQFNS
jgi:hypothetical protein